MANPRNVGYSMVLEMCTFVVAGLGAEITIATVCNGNINIVDLASRICKARTDRGASPASRLGTRTKYRCVIPALIAFTYHCIGQYD